ncbi:F0F1 ATP synthase subunit delta [Deferribacterales bacterium RsTz2092]|nr:ATP synthase subunit delta [Deferribacterales bacterium]
MINSPVAVRYADALYFEALSSGNIDAVTSDLAQLKELLLNNDDFATFVSSLALSASDRIAVINALAKKGAGLNRLTQGLLVVLANNRRLNQLEAVVEVVERRIMEANGELEVRVEYAVSITDAIRKSLLSTLEKLTGRKIVLKEFVNESLLGGMKVFVDSMLYDLSLRGKFDRLKMELSK